MMIVKERSVGAVLAALAWIGLVWLWHSGDLANLMGSVDARQSAHGEMLDDHVRRDATASLSMAYITRPQQEGIAKRNASVTNASVYLVVP